MNNNMNLWSEETQKQLEMTVRERFMETCTVTKVFIPRMIAEDILTEPTNSVIQNNDGSLLVDTSATTAQTRLWINVHIPEEQTDRALEVALAAFVKAALTLAVGLDRAVLCGTGKSTRKQFLESGVHVRSTQEIRGLVDVPSERIEVPPLSEPQRQPPRIWSTNTNAQAAGALSSLENKAFFGASGMFLGRDQYHDINTPLTPNEITTPYQPLKELFELGIHNTAALTSKDRSVIVRPHGTMDLGITEVALQAQQKDPEDGTWIIRVTIGFIFRLQLPGAVEVLEFIRPE